VENDLAAILGDTAAELMGQPLSKTSLDDLINAHVKAFVNVCVAPDGLKAMLDRLHSKYRLAVVSNYPLSDCIRLSLKQSGIAHCFETTIVSGDLGVMKPSRRIFDKVLSVLNLPPESVLFVGDDWIADIVGAWASGMPCMHINSGSKQKPETSINTFGIYLKQALDLPELSGWQKAKPLAKLNSVLELEGWLDEWER
jgi:HAD superfamily hydrolase (TIGR01509 family)